MNFQTGCASRTKGNSQATNKSMRTAAGSAYVENTTPRSFWVANEGRAEKAIQVRMHLLTGHRDCKSSLEFLIRLNANLSGMTNVLESYSIFGEINVEVPPLNFPVFLCCSYSGNALSLPSRTELRSTRVISQHRGTTD